MSVYIDRLLYVYIYYILPTTVYMSVYIDRLLYVYIYYIHPATNGRIPYEHINTIQ